MQASLLPRVGVLGPSVRQPRASVLVRSETPRVNQGRTFREDDGSVTGADGKVVSESNNQPLYADQVQRQAAANPRKSNLSKEMRSRLREEYTGLGGSADKDLVLHPRRPLIVAAVSVEEKVRTQQSEASTSGASDPAPKGASKWVIDPNENLKSTAEHRFWTFLSMGVLGATFVQGIAGISTVSEVPSAVAAILGAYVLSDLGTGIYHWGVDNYGGPQTPFFGRQIAAFQGHHQRPWTITEREFCNNVHQVFKPAVAPGVFFLALSPFVSPVFNTFISSFIFLVCMSQQFHAWSHMKKSELPGFIVALQDANVLISRKNHGAHHRAPFADNYCIVSGLWNPLLDSTGFFKAMENFFHKTTGVEPRSWYEPNADWAELERPTSS